jgi:hypothetical protein
LARHGDELGIVGGQSQLGARWHPGRRASVAFLGEKQRGRQSDEVDLAPRAAEEFGRSCCFRG